MTKPCASNGGERGRSHGQEHEESRNQRPAPVFFRERAISMEYFFNCPYCGEEISMVLDLSVRRQTYVEDCEVCCNPIEISYSVEDDALAGFSAKVLE
jgi:hypothetical protein